LCGNKNKILRAFPIIPGVDYAGVVEKSASDQYRPGDNVIMHGRAMGEQYSGGFSQYARTAAKDLVPMPGKLTARMSMLAGTAGATAALCVIALRESGYVPDGGAVVVSGASGGVGSFAVMLLAKLGYEVVAVSRPAAADYLRGLGAADVIGRETMSADCRPLEKAKWHGGIDTVGGKVLARMLAETRYGGVVAACGLAGGFDLPTTVMPFILRGVRLDGVDSVMIPQDRRVQAWQLLADTLAADDYEKVFADECALADAPAAARKILDGEVSGRFLVNPN
ncbi:MAG: acryloyl-CoA reductase, partial [Gammaproteobacteria bacterium]